MYDSILNLLKRVAATVYGWSIAGLNFVFAFFAPEKYSFNLVLFAIFLDALFGVMVAVKQGKFLKSKLARVTIFKIVSYFSALMLLYMVEKLVHGTGFIGIKVAAAWAAACEFWSMSANVLILRPNMPFFRLIRKQLKGEISAKLGGTDLDDILPEDKK